MPRPTSTSSSDGLTHRIVPEAAHRGRPERLERRVSVDDVDRRVYAARDGGAARQEQRRCRDQESGASPDRKDPTSGRRDREGGRAAVDRERPETDETHFGSLFRSADTSISICDRVTYGRDTSPVRLPLALIQDEC